MALLTLILSSYWKQLAIGTAIIAALGYSYHLGADNVQEKWSKATLEATGRVLDKERNNQLITNGVSHAYQTNIAAIDALYDSVQPTGAGNLPSVPNATGRPNAATGCNGFSEVKRRAAQKQTAQLIWLQTWLREQSK